MEKYSFNMLLFSRLPKVLDISEAEIARRCGLTQQVMNRYTNAGIMLSVQKLLKICNALRMPAHYFVSENDRHVMPDREAATLPPDCWQPVRWDTQAVELTFGDGEGKIYWKDVAVVMNLSSQKPHDQFLLRTRLTVDGFLSVCSHYDISPFHFLIDPNRPDGPKRKAKGRAAGKAAVPLPQPADDIAALTRRLDNLNANYEDLKKKYESLLSAHEALAKRVSVNIENINNSSVNIATDGHE